MASRRDLINYSNINNNNAETVSSFNWDLIFTPPSGTYWPGDDIFLGRVKEVSGLPPHNVDIQDVEGPGGFRISMPKHIEHGPIDVSFSILDYEESTIFQLASNWASRIEEANQRTSIHKRHLVCQCELSQTDTWGNKIYTWHLKNGILKGFDGYHTSFGTAKNWQDALKLTIHFEFWDVKQANAANAQV